MFVEKNLFPEVESSIMSVVRNLYSLIELYFHNYVKCA